MTQIELTENEANMLKEILRKHLTELNFEMAFCHRRDTGDVLRKRKEFIEGLIQWLQGAPEEKVTRQEAHA